MIVLEHTERGSWSGCAGTDQSAATGAAGHHRLARGGRRGERRQLPREVGVARHTVAQWRRRFAAERLAGLRDRPHRPLPRRYGAEQQAAIVVLACQPPADLGWVGQTHWTLVDLARYIQEHPELGLGTPSKSTLGRILQAHDLRLDRL